VRQQEVDLFGLEANQLGTFLLTVCYLVQRLQGVKIERQQHCLGVRQIGLLY
jgi:hypothetical protein